MKINQLITEEWRIDGGVAFGVVPKTIWTKFYQSDENNLIRICNRLLLIETNGSLILIDTGFGEKRDSKYYMYKYIDRQTPLRTAINSLGYNVEEVTDVIFTHLHDDHSGGAVEYIDDQYIPVCKNATHWVSEQQLKWALNPNPREAASYFKDNIQVLIDTGILKTVSKNGTLFPGIDFMLYDGHTAGQIIPLIKTLEGTIAYMADFIPSKAHIPLPYVAGVDIQPLKTLEEKSRFLERAVSNRYTLCFQHDYYNECCKVELTDKGYRGCDSYKILEFKQ